MLNHSIIHSHSKFQLLPCLFRLIRFQIRSFGAIPVSSGFFSLMVYRRVEDSLQSTNASKFGKPAWCLYVTAFKVSVSIFLKILTQFFFGGGEKG